MVECSHGTDQFKGREPMARHAIAEDFFGVLKENIAGWVFCAVDHSANAQAVIDGLRPRDAALLGAEYAIAFCTLRSTLLRSAREQIRVTSYACTRMARCTKGRPRPSWTS